MRFKVVLIRTSNLALTLERFNKGLSIVKMFQSLA